MKSFRRLPFYFILLAVTCLYHSAILAEELTLPATGVWNGFNDQLNVIECTNVGGQAGVIKVTVRDSAGALVGEQNVRIAGNAGPHVVLNAYPIEERHGTYVIEQVTDGVTTPRLKLSCMTSFYRMSAVNAPKEIEYAYSLPVTSPLRGESAGIFNSINPQGDAQPVINWLSIYSPSDDILEGVIHIHDQNGGTIDQIPFANIAPGNRMDIPLGHPDGQVVGMYRITMFDSNADYGAFLTRYSTDGSGFNFAFPLLAKRGSCDSGPIPASTMDPATNWGEVANPSTVNPVEVVIEVRNAAGQLLHTELRNVKRYAQEHIYLNQYLGPRNVGTFRVRCRNSTDPNKRILTQSLFYGHRPNDLGRVEWAYASQPPDDWVRPGDALVAPINTFFDAANWLKLLDFDTVNAVVQESIYQQDGIFSRTSYRHLGASGGADIPAHEGVGQDYVGLITASTKSVGSLFGGELLRVFPHAEGGLGYIMRVPGTRIRDAITSNSQSVNVPKDTTTEFTVSVSNEEQDIQSWWISVQPQNGQVRLQGAWPNLTYTPNQQFLGQDSFEFRVWDGTTSSRGGVVYLNVSGWQPPIGHPMPSFGFNQQTRSRPQPWTTGTPGYYYVETFNQNATDAGNPYGTPAVPRQTIPQNLPAGAVVEVNGTYAYGIYQPITGTGTPTQPIFIRGRDANNKPRIVHPWHVSGSYIIFENLLFDDADGDRDNGITGGLLFIPPGHHNVLRYSEVAGNLDSGGVHVFGWGGNSVHNVVIYENVIRQNGEQSRWTDRPEVHGVSVGSYAHTVWVARNEIRNNGGYGVLVSAANLAEAGTTHHIYVGENDNWSNRLSGYWVRYATDVVLSRNRSRYHYAGPPTIGACMGFDSGPQRVWFLYNEMEYCEVGIGSGVVLDEDEGEVAPPSGPGDNIFLIGNVFHRMTNNGSNSSGVDTGGVGIRFTDNGPVRYVFNNTFHDLLAGITYPSGIGQLLIANNIFSAVQDRHIAIRAPQTAQATFTHSNLFELGAMFDWAGVTADSIWSLQQRVPGQCAACDHGDPAFVDDTNRNYRLRSTSRAISKANGLTLDLALQQFQTQYGISINVDYDRNPRTLGTAMDLGAFEFDALATP